MNKLWKELEISPEEEKLAEEIVNDGAGKSLSQELLNQYHVEKEWDLVTTSLRNSLTSPR